MLIFTNTTCMIAAKGVFSVHRLDINKHIRKGLAGSVFLPVCTCSISICQIMECLKS